MTHILFYFLKTSTEKSSRKYPQKCQRLARSYKSHYTQPGTIESTRSCCMAIQYIHDDDELLVE